MEVFLAIVDYGSFSAAARESFLTQSTVSQHMAALEDEVGLQLLERSRDGVRLTDAGKILRKYARQVEADLRATKEALRRHRGEEEATLRLAASTIPGDHLVPTVLARMCGLSPGLHPVVFQGGSREVTARVANGEAEVGVVGSRFEERGLTYAPVGSDEIRLVVPGRHPWAGLRAVALLELQDLPLVVRGPGSGTAKTVTEALAAAGVDTARLRVQAHLGSNESVKAAVLAGLGASFLSEVAIRRDVERGDLAVVPIEGFAISRQFHLVRRTGRELSPAASEFWERMVEAYG